MLKKSMIAFSFLFTATLFAQTLSVADMAKAGQLIGKLNHVNNLHETAVIGDYDLEQILYNSHLDATYPCTLYYTVQHEDRKDIFRFPIGMIKNITKSSYNSISNDYNKVSVEIWKTTLQDYNLSMSNNSTQFNYYIPARAYYNHSYQEEINTLEIYAPYQTNEIFELFKSLTSACRTEHMGQLISYASYSEKVQVFMNDIKNDDLSAIRQKLANKWPIPAKNSLIFNIVKSDSMAKILLAAGFNINFQTDSTKETALQLAIINKNRNLVQILLQNGADPSLKDLWQNNAFHTLALGQTTKTAQGDLRTTQTFFEFFDKNDAGINDLNMHGCRPLNYVTNSEIKKIFKNNDAKKKLFGCKNRQESSW